MKTVKDLKNRIEWLKDEIASLTLAGNSAYQSERYWQVYHLQKEIEDLEICLSLNDTLKECETWEQFEALLKRMESYGRGYSLVGNRRGYQTYAFSHMGDKESVPEWDRQPDWVYAVRKNKVHYLYADSCSTGQGFVPNLYRALTVVP